MGIYSNRQTSTTGVVALPSRLLFNGVVLTALPTNTGTIYVGDYNVTTATGYPLAAGQSISYNNVQLSEIYIIGSNTTDVLTFTGN